MLDSNGFRTVPALGYKQGAANKIVPVVKVERSKIVLISNRALKCNVLSERCNLFHEVSTLLKVVTNIFNPILLQNTVIEYS
jgi:hypothetical protein